MFDDTVPKPTAPFAATSTPLTLGDVRRADRNPSPRTRLRWLRRSLYGEREFPEDRRGEGAKAGGDGTAPEFRSPYLWR
jgi:hypothetical protein